MPETKKEKVSIDELSLEFKETGASLQSVPAELSPGQKLTRFMSIILLLFVVMLIIMSVNLWDGTKEGPFSDLWEYTKLIGTTIIGGVVATYLQNDKS